MNFSEVIDCTKRKVRILLLTLAIMVCGGVKAVQPDSIWYDSISGTRTHLQRIDTLSPYTCPLHFFGKRADGTPKLPALQAMVENLGINALVFSWDHFVTDREWARVTNSTLHQNLTGGWVWDNDSFSGNQFAHPYHGSMFYNAAREHGLSYGVSLLYPLAGSLTWELFCETNRPATNDLLSTGIGGAAIGEVTHRASDIFFDNTKTGANRVLCEIIGTFLNPVRGLHRILSGEMFRVNHLYAGKKEEPEPYSFQIGFGDRYIHDVGAIHPQIGHRYHEHIPFFDIRFNYGNHYNNLDEGKATRAFDYFNIYALVNLDSDHPTVGELDISGRIGSIQRQLPHRWKLDIGFYQNIKYIDHYSYDGHEDPGNLTVISEAASFGAGFHAERQGIATTLKHDLQLSAVPLGGAAADYFPMRRYNFGTGFSLRHQFQYTWNRHITFGNQFYLLRLFIVKSANPETLQQIIDDPEGHELDLRDGINAWGDKGEQTVLQNRLFFQFNIARNLQLHLQHEFNLRHGNYRQYPSLTGKSHEWKAGLSYAL
ncbi:MAG: DUF3943 domain-containing protein [Bacteroidaceae bacterium]|nr:DUF3943 domain-containing protein [Bacteroidaceae bacterium]